MVTPLPETHSAFFVHYQCDLFIEGTKIYRLAIYAKGKVKEFTGENEAEYIAAYCQNVTELCSEGLIPIHWNQYISYFGIAHITSRYKVLTGNEIDLKYLNGIDLADWMIERYGERYASNPRLNTLAKLNDFRGSIDASDKTQIGLSDRLMLIVRVYYRAFHNTLITEIETPFQSNVVPEESKPAKTEKQFSAFLSHQYKEKLAKALKDEFATEKSKALRLMIEALLKNDPALITILDRENKILFNSMKSYFDRDIGSYSGIFDYDYNRFLEKDVEAMESRIKQVLTKI